MLSTYFVGGRIAIRLLASWTRTSTDASIDGSSGPSVTSVKALTEVSDLPSKPERPLDGARRCLGLQRVPVQAILVVRP